MTSTMYECQVCGKEFETNHSAANHRTRAHTDEDIEAAMLQWLRDLANDLGRTPTSDDVEDRKAFSVNTFQSRFGTWNQALTEAALEINCKYRTKTTVSCDNCGATLERTPSKIYEHVFCDESCMGEWESEQYSGDGNPRYNKTEVSCGNCGESLLRARWEREAREDHYCDFDCRGEHWQRTGVRSGSNSPVWKGGSVEYYGSNWRFKRREVLERDDKTCQDCGLTWGESVETYGFGLDVHHRIPIREFDEPEDANDLVNLITLCRCCHQRWEHLPVQIDTRGLA